MYSASSTTFAECALQSYRSGRGIVGSLELAYASWAREQLTIEAAYRALFPAIETECCAVEISLSYLGLFIANRNARRGRGAGACQRLQDSQAWILKRRIPVLNASSLRGTQQLQSLDVIALQSSLTRLRRQEPRVSEYLMKVSVIVKSQDNTIASLCPIQTTTINLLKAFSPP